jgi:hypothetical protein
VTRPMLADPVTLTVNPQVAQICGRTGGPVLVFNADPTQTAYVGYTKSIGVLNATPVAPLTYTTMDGNRTLFGFCPTGTVVLNITPGGLSQSASPANIALQIALAGVPSIDQPTSLYIVFNQTVAAGGTFTPPEIMISKFQSWFATMFCTATAAGTGTNPYTKFTMAWSIASDNFDPLVTHDWVVPNTPFNFVYNYRNDCQGPVFGDSLSMTWTNYDTQPVNVTIGLFGSYRPRIRPKLVGHYHWNVGTGATDDTRGLGSDGIVDIYNPAVPIAPGNTSATDLMNLLDGPATVTAVCNYAAAGAANFDVIIQPQPQSVLLTDIGIPIRQTAALGVAVSSGPISIMLPRRVCLVELNNKSNSASNITSAQIVVVAQHQPE